MVTTGDIIYQAFVPTLKMALCIATGFVVSRGGSLPPPAVKAVSKMTMNVGLPCLIFSSMVSAFTPQNVAAFGPLVMMAFLYQALGLLLAWVVREVVYVPKDFRWGILVMGMISNWGNLPTAVVQTVAKHEPFNPATDVDLGVAYIAIFILVMNTTFFALGTYRLCGWDFVDHRMISDPVPFKQRWRRRLGYVKSPSSIFRRRDSVTDSVTSPVAVEHFEWREASGPSESTGEELSTAPSRNDKSVGYADCLPPPIQHRKDCNPWSLAMKIICGIPAPTWAVLLGILFSMVQPLKALLTPTANWTIERIPNGPDGNPPLHFILDTTVYLGAITVPLALMLLGASFAQLKIPSWRDLPLAAIVSMTVIKMVIVPVFSIFVILALQRRTTLFPHAQKMRTFVAILLSGTPAAANQLVVTQLYNPEGSANTLASFLLLQYIAMFILSTALAAIALYVVQ